MKIIGRETNNKGFTLVELLAVIVILALILIIAIPAVFDVIDDSKKSTLHSKAKSIVTWYNNTVATESVSTKSETDKIIKLTDKANFLTDNEWVCLGGDFSDEFMSATGLNDEDFVIGGNAPSGDNPSIGNGTCSAMRRTANGQMEVLLIANKNGKFYVEGITYAYTGEATGNTMPINE